MGQRKASGNNTNLTFILETDTMGVGPNREHDDLAQFRNEECHTKV